MIHHRPQSLSFLLQHRHTHTFDDTAEPMALLWADHVQVPAGCGPSSQMKQTPLPVAASSRGTSVLAELAWAGDKARDHQLWPALR